MTILELQVGLIKWFRHEPSRSKSFSQVEAVCVNLFKQYFQDDDPLKAKYEILYPLLRWGLIEFDKVGKFRLSPSCFIESKVILIGININEESFSLLEDFLIKEIHYGLFVFRKNRDCLKYLKTKGYDVLIYDVSNMLSRLSTVENVCRSWDKDAVIETNSYQHFNLYSWESDKNNSLGIFRKGNQPFSQRVLKMSDNEWYFIPNRTSNIDAFNIAVFYSLIINQENLPIVYFKTSGRLEVRTPFFPIIVERLLFLDNLVSGGDSLERKYKISHKSFILLNKFFHNKIKVNE